ncbi:hypothetical protein RIF29_21478 [Crotalaria pallida]|uniref:Uncharacterized protein n=1 Tax=Crotalaria pallida TaxID=3830 RepID=A0AAN9F7I0_CROPI
MTKNMVLVESTSANPLLGFVRANEKTERMREESSPQEDDLKARSMKKVKTSIPEVATEQQGVDQEMVSDMACGMYGHRADMCSDAAVIKETGSINTNEMGLAGTAMDSGTVVVSNGNMNGLKEGENSSAENIELPDAALSINEDRENVKENPFGPWMLVKRFPRNRERGGQKGGVSRGDLAGKKGQFMIAGSSNNSGSHFNALIENENGELIEGNIPQGTCTLHEVKQKEINEVNEVGPSGRSASPNAESGPLASKALRTPSLQQSPVPVHNPKMDAGLDKEIVSRMKMIQQEGVDFISRMATKVYLPSNEAFALIQHQNERSLKEVPPDLTLGSKQQDTTMGEELHPMIEESMRQEKAISDDSGSQIPISF